MTTLNGTYITATNSYIPTDNVKGYMTNTIANTKFETNVKFKK